MIYFVQGAFVVEEEAKVPVLDRGFLYGDSVYEAIRARRGRFLFYHDHEARLRNSARLLGFDIDPSPWPLLDVLRELLRRNDLAEARMRIVVTRGRGDRDQVTGFTPTWVVIVERFEGLREGEYEKGVSAVLVGIVRNAAASLNPEAKSGNLLNSVLARQEAVRRGAAEGILLNPDGRVAEGAYSNIFWVGADGRLRTPSLSVGILPGVTRQKTIRVARGLGIDVEEVSAGPGELAEAREILLTSTSWEVLSVTRWEDRPVGDGRRGEVSRRLREGLLHLYEEPGEAA